MSENNNEHKFKFKLKSLKEWQEETKENWENFKRKSKESWQKVIDSINDVFGIPPNKKLQDIKSNQPINGSTFQDTKENGSISTINSIIEKGPEFIELFDRPEQSKDSNNTLKNWNENWKNFSENVISSFDNMINQIKDWNSKNIEKIQEQMLNNEINWKIWLKKQEIKRKQKEEQQKLAALRFKAWVDEHNKKFQRYFEVQKEKWKLQLEKWKKEQEQLKQNNKQKWIEKQQKFKEDYQRWIQQRRDQAMEKAKFKLRIGWRQNLYITMSLLPVIIVVVLIIALVNAITK